MALTLSRLGFGAAPIAGLYTAVDPDTAAATVDAAWEAGVRYFDTAPHYGLGVSERRLGAALAGRDRDAYVVSTKAGRLLVPGDGGGDDDEGRFAVPATHRRVWDLSRDGIRRSLDDSLARLGLDRVDVLYLHDPEDRLDQALATALPALAELRDEGAVRAVGAGSKDAAALARLVRGGGLDVVMVAGRYTLLEQPALDELFPACAAAGTDVVAAGVYNSGLLAAPEPDPASTYEYAAAPPDVLARARDLATVCAEHGAVLPQAALQFPLRHPLVRSAVVGMRSPAEVRQNAAWLGAPVAPELWAALEGRGLIPADEAGAAAAP
ncbi:aldo/keto reductase [Jiangella alkaliphila]|uniref:D-threo-aldose 1-dehydrogenase n=1 Tax=Jiangella alkaliphila TaxID=419479 RepID=A0A1H2IGT6_9ACTN|nr:aldo/keto reductase [Jiangella alkaliphila]SDU43303.1 D-threo-aldose 1-dehydrogenase [Jiangella alkaliphila]